MKSPVVRMMSPGRTSSTLIGSGTVLTLLLGTAALRSVLAGSPAGWNWSNLACLFLPTQADMGTHLLSYALILTLLVSLTSCLILLCKQWTKIHSLTRNLAMLNGRDSALERLTQRLGLRDKVQFVSSEVSFCFCTGFISPHIYLSQGMVEKLTPRELEALLLHEKHHLKNRDPLKMLLGKLVVSVLFFVPALKDMLKRYSIEKEIAADQSAIQYQGYRRGLAGALQKLVLEHATVPDTSLAVGGGDALGHRIDHLRGHVSRPVHPIPFSRFVTSFFITAFILALVLVPLPGSHPVNSDMGSTLSCVVHLGSF